MQETPLKEDVETILAKGKKKRRPAAGCGLWKDFNVVTMWFLLLESWISPKSSWEGNELVARVGILSFAIPRTCNFSVLYVLSLPYITCFDRV